ncbi:MAG TPA: 1-deoxy-D-xylulose-5-phosphate synthase [Armatimonadota bacterium]|nr:1-deoxy-D-xylulose-5-phosphate synthase [Armatimonadota bacterium]
MTSLLEQLNSPNDLKHFSREQLPILADEIRTFLLQTLAETGGHLGSNLGVVELTIALHYIFDSPQDRLIWDVSHQCYTHKILTGRRDRFHTLRQLDGMSGFTKRQESVHDAFDAGHGGTSISAALGMARARTLQKIPGRVVAIIGDGALTSGMALEALNDGGHSELNNFMVILNDNEMAISPNVGGMASYLSRIRSEPSYLRAKENFEALMQRLPGGGSVVGIVERMKAAVKQMVTPGMFFEDLGFTYLGPIDGHDIGALLNALQQARRLDGPVFLHVLTTKGKGYLPAENHRSRLHGVGAFDIHSGKPKARKSGETFTEAFGESICRLAHDDSRIVAISAAMCDGTGLEEFERLFPSRFYDVGMAEEHAVTLAAGMACEGLRPITAIYSTFSQRAYDQLLHDVCMQNLPVVLALDRAGLVGEDGPTHHGVFDLSFLRMMPNMTVMVPATLAELGTMLETATHHDGPCAIRYPKGKAAIAAAGDLVEIPHGKAAVLRDGLDVALFAVGTMVSVALDTAELLAQNGIDAAVVNARFVKPLDSTTLLAVARKVKHVVTLEENVITGGFGSAVQELFSQEALTTPIHLIGLPDAFVEHGSRAQLFSRLELTPQDIAAEIRHSVGQLERCETLQ